MFVQDWFPSLRFKPNGTGVHFFNERNRFLNQGQQGRRSLFDDKIVLSNVLRGFGLPTTTQVCTISHGKVLDSSGREFAIEALSAYLKGGNYFVKSRGGYGGTAAFVIADGRPLGQPDNTSPQDLTTILKRGRWVVEDLLDQAPFYRQPAPSSLNTVRIITYRSTSGAVRTTGAVWRMGGGGAVVDNATVGGVFAGIDIMQKRLLGAGHTKAGATTTSHPDTGFEFAKKRLPDLEHAFELCSGAHNLVRSPPFIGWDVAMTLHGPVIVEGNTIIGNSTSKVMASNFKEILWGAFLKDVSLPKGGWPERGRSAQKSDTLRCTIRVQVQREPSLYAQWAERLGFDKGVPLKCRSSGSRSLLVDLAGWRRDLEFMIFQMARGPRGARVHTLEFERIDVLF